MRAVAKTIVVGGFLVFVVLWGSSAPGERGAVDALIASPKCQRCHDWRVVRAVVERARRDVADCVACHDATPATHAMRGDLSAAPLQTAVAGTSMAKAGVRIDMVLIPAGAFWMGSDDRHPDEGPKHRVTLPSFSIDRYEVTNADYRAHLTAIGGRTNEVWPGGDFSPERANHPVANVTWHEAKAYCEWRGARLPTEAEWEKAARGTDGRTFPWGPDMDPKLANIAESHIGHTLPVGSFPEGRSPYGLYDMAGNVWEWAEEWYQPYPGNHDPDENYGERYKVARGGGYKVCTFYGCGSHAPTFNRAFFNPVSRNETFGFRCARSGDRE